MNSPAGWCKSRSAVGLRIPDSDSWNPADENSSQCSREIKGPRWANKKRSFGCALLDGPQVGS